MASAQQIRANHANAQLSTGPRDTTRTRLNATQHGLTGKQAVIAGESQAEYEDFHAGLMKELGPGSEIEKLLVERIVVAAWRLRRFARVEAAFFNSRIDAFLEANPGEDPDAALAQLFCDEAEAKKMRLFLRYQTAVQREYDNAMRSLDQARKERAHREFMRAAAQAHATPSIPNLPVHPEFQSDEPEIGFASQTFVLRSSDMLPDAA